MVRSAVRPGRRRALPSFPARRSSDLTAARALGVMQSALEEARAYAKDRIVFGQSVYDYQLTQAKLARMAVTIQGARQFSYEVARSEEHTSELQSREISYAVFCLKKKT